MQRVMPLGHTYCGAVKVKLGMFQILQYREYSKAHSINLGFRLPQTLRGAKTTRT